jgi:hypothetical protein
MQGVLAKYRQARRLRKAGCSFASEWSCGSIFMQLSIFPSETIDINQMIGGMPYETVIEDGIKCYVAVNEVCWDGTNENSEWIGGTSYSKSIVFEQNGLICTFSGEADDQSVSLDIISSRTARLLMDDPGKIRPEAVKQSEYWQLGYVKGIINLGVSISPAPFGQAKRGDVPRKELDIVSIDLLKSFIPVS